jgi:2-dehydro-3-deoxy-D-gluconate 5-dehydrogenase
MNLFDLTGKVAIVTGASRGIGAAIAIGLAQAGADLLLVSRTMPLNEIYTQLDAAGHRYEYFSADMSQLDSVEPVINTALERFGHIDILVNNAGIVRRVSFLEHTVKDWEDVLNTNLTVPVFLAQAAARQMIKQGTRGKIVNICSMLSFQGGINLLGYASSKHGLAGATKHMANELAKHNINANGLAPGYIETKTTEAIRKDEVRYNTIKGRIPQGRWGTPEEMAGAGVFLCSSASDYMNGHILAVDGGWLSS